MAPGFSTMGSLSLYHSVTEIRDDILSRLVVGLGPVIVLYFVALCNFTV